MSYREWMRARAPRWLSRMWGQRWMFVTGIPLDAWTDASMAAVKARFPSRGPQDALHVQGDERLLDRAPGEGDAAYIARLRNSFPSYRQGESATGVQARLAEAGFPTAVVHEANDWISDGGPWSRFWVTINDPTLVTLTWSVGDGTLLGAGKTLGGLSSEKADLLRKIILKWKGAHPECVAVILIASGHVLSTGWTLGSGVTLGGKAARFVP